MSPKETILHYIIEFLQVKVPNFKINKMGKLALFTCPICKHTNTSALIIPGTSKIRCNLCNKVHGNIVDIARVIIPELKEETEDNIYSYIRDTLKLDVKMESEIDKALNIYYSHGFDLVPVARNQKAPIELDWTKKSHKEIYEWKEWLIDNLNIGVKTGKCSGITILDLDQKEVPEEIKNLLVRTLTQETQKGFQFFFKYVAELPNTRIEEYKLDILNDGKQAVVYPSVVNNYSRTINLADIVEIPKELIAFLKTKVSVPVKTFSEKIAEQVTTGELDLSQAKLIPEGGRNNFLLSFGGILRKELNNTQTGYTLSLINRYLCSPPLPMRDLDRIVTSLDKYAHIDEQELALKIFQYMKIVESAVSKDIAEALGERGADAKQRLEKAIAYLVKEGFLVKKGRLYFLVKKAEWKETFMEDGRLIDFKMPYFDNYAMFRNGDLIIIGGLPGSGKSHVSMNIIKQLVAQGKKPNYVCLESGNRFVTIAKSLGLKEGDFKHCVSYSPESLEIEDNCVTIIDWICPDDYASTDKIYKHFSEELVKHGGILIVFVQLMRVGKEGTGNEFFAKNLIEFFPAFVAKFLYEDDTGVNSYFQITKIREPKGHYKAIKIPTKYNYSTKELQLIEDIEK
jgi:hypothetical protein